jgi:type IV secretion system protein VirB9
MTVMIVIAALSCSLGCVRAAARDPDGQDRPEASAKPEPAAGIESRARRIKYGEEDVVTVRAKLRFTTLIVLPREESILDFTCGDREYWIVNGARNLAYVKPARAGARTNINLITASGNVYSFAFDEVSEAGGAEPDLKVFVEPRDESIVSAMKGEPRFVPAGELENYRDQLVAARAETREARAAAVKAIDQFVAGYPARLRFDYRFRASERPFLVSAIYHDDRFTYIRARPAELPALYEVRDGKPNLVEFQYRDGTFVVSKVLDGGYLTIGKRRFDFLRKE